MLIEEAYIVILSHGGLYDRGRVTYLWTRCHLAAAAKEGPDSKLKGECTATGKICIFCMPYSDDKRDSFACSVHSFVDGCAEDAGCSELFSEGASAPQDQRCRLLSGELKYSFLFSKPGFLVLSLIKDITVHLFLNARQFYTNTVD